MQVRPFTFPAPVWSVTKWLCKPDQNMSSESQAELRMSMFRRLEAVIASAVATPALAAVAVARHPTLTFEIWLVLEIGIALFRIPYVISLIYRLKQSKNGEALGKYTVDLFVLIGTAWSALLGYGCLITILTNDLGLINVISCAGLAIVAGQSIRNPSAPRLNALQMGLILLLSTVGFLLNPTPVLHWLFFCTTGYYFAMVSMTRQIHQDYIAMIVAQVENRRFANQCGLTGLPNRRYFDASLQALLQARRNGDAAVLSVDLDGFKSVNDTHGHQGGDKLLTQVADRLKRLCTPNDVVARLGGDEFAILLSAAHGTEASALAGRIVASIAEPFYLESDVVANVGASVGITTLDQTLGPDDSDLIMMRADTALYEAKAAGKGTFRSSKTELTVLRRN